MKIYRIQLGRKGGERISYLDPILTFNFLQEKLLRQTSTPLRFITKARNEVMKIRLHEALSNESISMSLHYFKTTVAFISISSLLFLKILKRSIEPTFHSSCKFGLISILFLNNPEPWQCCSKPFIVI